MENTCTNLRYCTFKRNFLRVFKSYKCFLIQTEFTDFPCSPRVKFLWLCYCQIVSWTRSNINCDDSCQTFHQLWLFSITCIFFFTTFSIKIILSPIENLTLKCQTECMVGSTCNFKYLKRKWRHQCWLADLISLNTKAKLMSFVITPAIDLIQIFVSNNYLACLLFSYVLLLFLCWFWGFYLLLLVWFLSR